MIVRFDRWLRVHGVTLATQNCAVMMGSRHGCYKGRGLVLGKLKMTMLCSVRLCKEREVNNGCNVVLHSFSLNHIYVFSGPIQVAVLRSSFCPALQLGVWALLFVQVM
jgi:hypothetical protein